MYGRLFPSWGSHNTVSNDISLSPKLIITYNRRSEHNTYIKAKIISHCHFQTCQEDRDSNIKRLGIYYELLWIYYECTLQVLGSDAMSGIREWNILLDEIKDITLWSCSFIAGLEKIQWWYKSRITLALACVLYLNLLLYIWLYILE